VTWEFGILQETTVSKHNRERRKHHKRPAGFVATTAQAIQRHGETGVLFQAAMTEEQNKGEQVLILCCVGRKQAEAEGIVFDNDASYLLIAWSWDGPIGRYLRKH
jgi:hypothetical protein